MAGNRYVPSSESTNENTYEGISEGISEGESAKLGIPLKPLRNYDQWYQSYIVPIENKMKEWSQRYPGNQRPLISKNYDSKHEFIVFMYKSKEQYGAAYPEFSLYKYKDGRNVVQWIDIVGYAR